MDMKHSLIPALLLVLLLCCISCSKTYEEGGLKEDAATMLTKEWQMKRAFKNGIEFHETEDNPQIGEVSTSWLFAENGNCFTNDGKGNIAGPWVLKKNNRQLEINILTIPDLQTYDIVQLTDNGTTSQMIWEHKIEGNVFRYELEAE